jgi:hypothetical protein
VGVEVGFADLHVVAIGNRIIFRKYRFAFRVGLEEDVGPWRELAGVATVSVAGILFSFL